MNRVSKVYLSKVTGELIKTQIFPQQQSKTLKAWYQKIYENSQSVSVHQSTTEMSYSNCVINFDNAKTIVHRALNKDADVEVVDHHLEPYSKDKVGFLGAHEKLIITVKQKEDDKPIELVFFVKSLPRESNEQLSFVQHHNFFAKEVQFFNYVLPQMLEATALGEVEQWTPNCYLADKDIIVLEDVRIKGYKMPKDRIFDGKLLKSTARTMARLHASSLLVENKLGKSMKELYPEACTEQIFTKYMREETAIVLEPFIQAIAEKYGYTAKHMKENLDRAYQYFHCEERKPRVLCHGDPWPNNCMMDSSEIPKCLLVDYQILRYAPCMFDVAQMIYLSTTRETRRELENEAVNTYHNELCDILNRCDPFVDIPSLDHILKEYEEARRSAVLSAIQYFPVILLSKEVQAEYEEDLEALHSKFIFRQSNDCVLELMEKDKEYGSRIRDIVLEFLEICEKF